MTKQELEELQDAAAKSLSIELLKRIEEMPAGVRWVVTKLDEHAIEFKEEKINGKE